jgi:hypothetical protein
MGKKEMKIEKKKENLANKILSSIQKRAPGSGSGIF